MEWREFLRPTRNRIKLSIIIFLIFPAPTYNTMVKWGSFMCQGPDTIISPLGVVIEVFQLTTNQDARQHLQVNPAYYDIIFPLYIVLLIVSYVISCWFVKRGYQAHDMFVSLAIIFLFVVIILNTLNSFLEQNFAVPECSIYFDPYNKCEVYCQSLSARYSSNETALIAARDGNFCRDPYLYDSIDGNCMDYVGECEVMLVDGTSVVVDCG